MMYFDYLKNILSITFTALDYCVELSYLVFDDVNKTNHRHRIKMRYCLAWPAIQSADGKLIAFDVKYCQNANVNVILHNAIKKNKTYDNQLDRLSIIDINEQTNSIFICLFN